MAALSSIAMGAGALLGGVAGAKGKKATSEQDITSSLNVAPEGALERLGGSITQEQLQQLSQLIGGGPGQQDVTAGTGAQRGLADMLQQYAQGGFMPGEQDFKAAQQFAQGSFAGQQAALGQQFQDQATQQARLAAQLNRPINDPILQAKMQQEQVRQQQLLEGQKTSLATQFAQSLPGQRLGYAQQRAEVLGGLASQALANRQALLGLGSQVQVQGQNFRIQTGQKRQTGTATEKSGGGFMGALSGAIGGASLGAGAANLFGGGSGGGLGSLFGGGGSAPSSNFSMPGFGSSLSPAAPAFNFSQPMAPSRLAAAAPSSPFVRDWSQNMGVQNAWRK